MVLGEKFVFNLINKKNFPFILAGFLFTLTAITLIVMRLFTQSHQMFWMAGETELLLYLILNAVISLIVLKIGNYLKKTLLSYTVNLLLVLFLIFILLGGDKSFYTEIVSIYSALIFCFFTSIFLILLIRQVLTVLKD